jgi:mRNA-degrading endonuclease RelE of RelBE toxin-antitoxin system
MYELSIKKSAAKAIARQPPTIRIQMMADLEALAANPDDATLDVERIGGSDYLRLKFRNPARAFRAVFTRDDDAGIIGVKAVEPRGQAYDVRRLQR